MTLQFDDENDEGQATAALAGWAEQLGFRLTRNEAGGRFTDLAGAPVTLDTTTVLATNGPLHGELCRRLAGDGV